MSLSCQSPLHCPREAPRRTVWVLLAGNEEETDMRVTLGILGGILAGCFLGYLAGIYLACEGSPVQLFDGGNLCGLFGVFLTGPLGAVGGGVAGWWLAR